MCVNVTHGPIVRPSSLRLAGQVTISMTLQSHSPTTVRIRYSLVGATITFRENGTLTDTIDRTVQVNGSEDVDLDIDLVPRSGSGTGAHVIDIEIREPGCGDKFRNAHVVGR